MKLILSALLCSLFIYESNSQEKLLESTSIGIKLKVS